MKKKINKKLSTSENPIYTEFTHEHLTTCDFRAGILYHYYDPETESERRLLDVYKLKKADMDMDLEMIAKKQFKKLYRISDCPFKTNKYSDILDIRRGTNPRISSKDLETEIESTIDRMDGIIKTAKITGLGKRTFGELYFIMGILTRSLNKSLFWMERAHNSDTPDAQPIIKFIQKLIKVDLLILPASNYAFDTEGYMHPLEDEQPDLNSEYAIKLNSKIISQVMYELTDLDQKQFVIWKKRQINLPY